MTEKEKATAKDLMYAWQKGWSSYIPNEKDDHPAILQLAKTCSSIARVDMEEEEGYMRIKQGIANIAAFCSGSLKWRATKLHLIEIKYQEVLLEMNEWRKAKASDKDKIEQNYIIDKERQRKQQEDFILSEKARVKSLIWAIDNWDYIWEHSERVYYKTNKQVSLDRKASIEDLQKKDENFILELKRETESMVQRWRDKLKTETIKP